MMDAISKMARPVDFDWWVFYQDDHADMGGIGFDGFETQVEALEFIQNRMNQKGEAASLDDYKLIKGERQKLKPVEIITKVGVE